jgi:hypothetical protein
MTLAPALRLHAFVVRMYQVAGILILEGRERMPGRARDHFWHVWEGIQNEKARPIQLR